MSDSGFGVDDDDIGLNLDQGRGGGDGPPRKDGTLRAARERTLDAVVVGAGISGEYTTASYRLTSPGSG